ncbi:MAG: PIN domain-containing protein [Planctomycetota bacterium]
MIGLDTNVLVRFLVKDDERQARRAKRLIKEAIETEIDVFLSDVVLCETVWVLEVSYRFKRPAIEEVLRSLLAARHLRFTSSDRIARAVAAYAAGRGDFADYVIREHATTAGCASVYTFDKALKTDDGFLIA